jgi:putative FmdB family regulatory protein
LPTYEYACTACGHRLEAVQSFSDDPLTECPECGAPLRKVYGNVGIVLKGSGFYKTDSRAASGANGAGGKKAEKAAADAGGAESTPSKETPKETSKAAGNGSGGESKPAATAAN